MSEGLNKVQLIGNLGADPEFRTTQGGQSVLSLRVATTERYGNKAGERQERTAAQKPPAIAVRENVGEGLGDGAGDVALLDLDDQGRAARRDGRRRAGRAGA